MLDFSSMLYRIPALLIALTFHEYAHALAADAMGDKTPRFMGRLSINPLAHLDIMGTLLLVLAGFGWAKPVPINPNNFRNYREGMIKVSFAGVGANLFLCFLSVFIMLGMTKFQILTNGTNEFLYWTMLYNVWFAFFNLIPIPPLDGSQLLGQFLPPKMAYDYENVVGRYGFVILIVIVFSGLSNLVIGPLSSVFIRLCYMVAHLIF